MKTKTVLDYAICGCEICLNEALHEMATGKIPQDPVLLEGYRYNLRELQKQKDLVRPETEFQAN